MYYRYIDLFKSGELTTCAEMLASTVFAAMGA
jgi:hypothetical protein